MQTVVEGFVTLLNLAVNDLRLIMAGCTLLSSSIEIVINVSVHRCYSAYYFVLSVHYCTVLCTTISCQCTPIITW